MDRLKTPSPPALDRGLSILEVLARRARGLTLAEIREELRIPRSSVHTLLVALERRGYLQRHEKTSRYMFGLKLFTLANMALNGIELRWLAAPFLKTLMENTKLTVHLAILEQNEAVLIDKLDPPGVLRPATWLGKRMDVHCTGVGKALIAHLDESELDRIIREHGLPRHNDNTIVSVRKLKQDLAQTRKQGYSVDDEEDELGWRCLGAPVFDATGEVIAAISLSGTVTQIDGENAVSLTEHLKRSAALISEHLGFVPKDLFGD